MHIRGESFNDCRAKLCYRVGFLAQCLLASIKYFLHIPRMWKARAQDLQSGFFALVRVQAKITL